MQHVKAVIDNLFQEEFGPLMPAGALIMSSLAVGTDPLTYAITDHVFRWSMS